MSWFHRDRGHSSSHIRTSPDLPEWSASVSRSHEFGLYSDAPKDECQAAEVFCATHVLEAPRLLPSHIIQSIREQGCACWGFDKPYLNRFEGTIVNDSRDGTAGSSGTTCGLTTVETTGRCGDTCIFSNLPIMGGLYQAPPDLRGVYYEVKVYYMEGVIAIGTACKPYPEWRFPGWNRLSAGLHLDDMRKFFEDPEGGQDFHGSITKLQPGEVIGCGYEFHSGEIFFTYNGTRFPAAFKGVYFPRDKQDVYAAIGVGGWNKLEVNFGREPFVWKSANSEEWRFARHIGCLSSDGNIDDQLPSYQEFRETSRVIF